MSSKSVLLSKEQRQKGFYFGGYEDGYYLKYKEWFLKSWTWEKPSQQEVDEEIARFERDVIGMAQWSL